METILVINGETYWQDFLQEYKVEQKKIQSTEWLLKDNQLYAIDQNGVCKPDKILWRVGTVSNYYNQTIAFLIDLLNKMSPKKHQIWHDKNILLKQQADCK